ncbi:DNA mismatch repair protein MutT [Lysinibacillus fusiformis]
MQVVEKAFGYITREHGEQIQVLVFGQNTVGAGIQVPKGTIEEGETPLEVRKAGDAGGDRVLTTLVVQELIAQDYFNHPSGVLQKRYFYHLTISGETKDTWQHYPTGLNEADLLFSFYWISAEQDTLLAKGHGDYLYRVLAKVKN